MSQGDYLQQKKLKTRLCAFQSSQTSQLPFPNNSLDFVELPTVLSSQDYTNFSKFNITTTVTNSLPTFSKLNTNTNQKIVFDMPQSTTFSLPTWTLCKDTNTRNNRLQTSTLSSFVVNIPPHRPLTQKQKDTASCRSGYPFWTDTSGNMYHWPGDNRIKTKYTNAPLTRVPIGPLAPTVKTIMQPIYGGGYA